MSAGIDHETAVCPVCEECFTRSCHAHKGGSGKQRIATQRFCGAACRQRANRVRRAIANNIPASARKRSRTSVTRPAVSQPGASTGPQWGVADIGVATSVTRPKNPCTYEIVPDECWPGMWRIRFPDGQLSDMVNLTRAREALASLEAADGPRPIARGDGHAHNS
jgi:hypothetical protein